MKLDRRSFLFLGAGALASKAFGELKVFTTGIENESVLKVTPLEIDLGIGRAFKAFHFSDTHLNFFDAEDFSAVDPQKKGHFHKRWCRFPQALQSFYASLEYAAARNLPLLHTGDLVDFVTGGNERVLRRNVAGLDMHYAIGNHEYQCRAPECYTQDEAGMRTRLQKYFKGDLTVSSRVIGGANFVAFDNARHNLREETIERVKAEFGKGLPVVLMCHIPPEYTLKFRQNSIKSHRIIAIGMGADPATFKERPLPKNPADRHDERTKAFYAWLREQKSLKAILCGHTHYEEMDVFSETANVYVAGGNYEGRAYEITFK